MMRLCVLGPATSSPAALASSQISSFSSTLLSLIVQHCIKCLAHPLSRPYRYLIRFLPKPRPGRVKKSPFENLNMSSSCDVWDDEESSEFSNFEFPCEGMPKRRKIAKTCGKKQAVAKSISLTLNTITENDDADGLVTFTNAPRTFVCETRGKTPKKSHKGSSPIAQRKESEGMLSLSRYEGLKSEDGLGQPDFGDITAKESTLSPYLEDLSSQSKCLVSDVDQFGSAIRLKEVEWNLLHQECLCVLKCFQDSELKAGASIHVVKNQDAIRLAAEFLQSG